MGGAPLRQRNFDWCGSVHYYEHRNKIGRSCTKSDKNLFARSSPVPILSLERTIFSFLPFEIETGPAEGSANTLPVSTSGHGPAVKSKISFLNS